MFIYGLHARRVLRIHSISAQSTLKIKNGADGVTNKQLLVKHFKTAGAVLAIYWYTSKSSPPDSQSSHNLAASSVNDSPRQREFDVLLEREVIRPSSNQLATP